MVLPKINGIGSVIEVRQGLESEYVVSGEVPVHAPFAEALLTAQRRAELRAAQLFEARKRSTHASGTLSSGAAASRA